MSKHILVAIHPIAGPINIDFRFLPGAPMTRWEPADPSEIEYLSNDMGPGFDGWAEAWLADHEEEAIELAEDEGP